MPQYVFECYKELGGCGLRIEITCLMSEFENQRPTACPQCQNVDSVQQILFPPKVNIPHTLGMLAERNSRLISADEKERLTRKNKDVSWIPTPDGMVHK